MAKGRRSDRLLVVMAKEPAAGKVKTRLQPQISTVEAAELYRCFLLDRLEEMEKLHRGIDRAVAYAPSGAGTFFAQVAGHSYSLLSQEGGGLSARLVRLFQGAFAEGRRAVCIIDSDSPDLPASLVTEAFAFLERGRDAVFGPCGDGGYYLVGLGRLAPGLFKAIPWSTAEVLEASLARASKLGLDVSLLPQWDDIDTYEDLLAFQQRNSPPPTEPAAAPRSRARISTLLRQERLSPGSA